MTRTRQALALTLLYLAACDRDDIQHTTTDTGGDASPEETFPQRMAEAYCATLFTCDPTVTCVVGDPVHATEAECIEVERTALEEASAAAKQASLIFDPQCVEATIAGYEEAGCHSTGYWLARDRSLLEVCAPYHGTIPAGEDPCFEVVGSEFSECAAGSLCQDGACTGDREVDCICEDGFACSIGTGDTTTCRPELSVGASCIDGMGASLGPCEDGSSCQSEFDEDGFLIGGSCFARVPDGGACVIDDDCDSRRCDEVCIPRSPYLCEIPPRRWR